MCQITGNELRHRQDPRGYLVVAGTEKLMIKRDFQRPEADQIAAFRDAPTGWVADACGRRGAIDHRIRPLSRSTRFVGTALTVQSRPVDNLAPYAALKFARPGDVLMVATDNCESAAVLGDILVGMAKNAGIVAAVTDGLVRDISGIDDVGIPTFARGLSPNSPQKDGPGSVGLPISLGGVLINPGDLVVGDDDGVVVVTQDSLADAIDALLAIATKEAAMEAAVERGATHPELIDAVIEEGQAVFID